MQIYRNPLEFLIMWWLLWLGNKIWKTHRQLDRTVSALSLNGVNHLKIRLLKLMIKFESQRKICFWLWKDETTDYFMFLFYFTLVCILWKSTLTLCKRWKRMLKETNDASRLRIFMLFLWTMMNLKFYLTNNIRLVNSYYHNTTIDPSQCSNNRLQLYFMWKSMSRSFCQIKKPKLACRVLIKKVAII